MCTARRSNIIMQRVAYVPRRPSAPTRAPLIKFTFFYFQRRTACDLPICNDRLRSCTQVHINNINTILTQIYINISAASITVLRAILIVLVRDFSQGKSKHPLTSLASIKNREFRYVVDRSFIVLIGSRDHKNMSKTYLHIASILGGSPFTYSNDQIHEINLPCPWRPYRNVMYLLPRPPVARWGWSTRLFFIQLQ